MRFPTREHIESFERYSDEVLQAIQACSQFSGLDRHVAEHILFIRSVRVSDNLARESQWKRTRR